MSVEGPVRGREPPLWRQHSDSVNAAFIGRAVGDRRFRGVLKTDLFDEAITDRVYASGPYTGKSGRRVRNADDGIFRREHGSDLLLRVSETKQGYEGAFTIGLSMA